MAGPTLVAWAARACLVLASACAFAFVAGGLWQAGALIDYFAQASGPPPRAVPATRGALPGRSEPPKPKPKPEPTLSPASSDVTVTSPPVAAAVTFEEQAEASEKVIPVGLEAAADDEEYELVLGEAPPPGSTRARAAMTCSSTSSPSRREPPSARRHRWASANRVRRGCGSRGKRSVIGRFWRSPTTRRASTPTSGSRRMAPLAAQSSRETRRASPWRRSRA